MSLIHVGFSLVMLSRTLLSAKLSLVGYSGGRGNASTRLKGRVWSGLYSLFANILQIFTK